MDDKNNISKSDLKKEMKVFLSTSDFENKVSKIVKNRLKDDKELEDKVVEITKNVITQLFKTLWVKRATWSNNLTNKGN
jgi:hypothetical protein